MSEQSSPTYRNERTLPQKRSAIDRIEKWRLFIILLSTFKLALLASFRVTFSFESFITQGRG